MFIDKTFERYKFLNSIGILKIYLFALKTNMFHSIFNAWMSALSIMTIVCFGNFFGVAVVDLNDFVFSIVLVPAIVTSIAALCDVIFIFLNANKKIFNVFDSYKKTLNYNEFIKKFNSVFKLYCVVGFFLYLFFACLIGYIARCSFLKERIYNHSIFMCSVEGFALLYGLIWNFASIFRLKRIEYNELLKLDNNVINNEVDKFRGYVYQLMFETIGCLLAFCSILVYYKQSIYTESNSAYYTYYYVVYFSLICLYIKKLYDWEFRRDNLNATLYTTRNIFNK